jgi:hypothetical protein
LPNASRARAPGAVVFEGVWKKFRSGPAHDSLRDFVPAFVRSASGLAAERDGLSDREFWAVRDVSFRA